MPIICNNCGQNVPDDSAFCPKCGAKIAIVRCVGCGAVLATDAKFCPNCGTPVGMSATPAEPDIPKEQIPKDAEAREPDQTAAVDTPRHSQSRFDWKYWSVSILRGYGTTRNTVEVADEAVVITSKLNKRAIYDAVKVPLKNIASVEVWEKVSIISSLMVAVLIGLFAGLMVLIPFGVTAIDPSTAEGIGTMAGITILAALVIWAGLFRMHHWRITIKTHKEPQYMIYEVSAKPKDHEILFQLQKAILDQAGIQGEPIRKKSNKLMPTIIASIIVILAIIAAMLLSRPEIFETKQTDEPIDNEPIQSVENEPIKQLQDDVAIDPPDPKHWIYNPYDILSSDTGALLNVQNFLWDQKYQSAVALAVIKDSLEYENLDNYAVRLKEDWGLREDDMVCLVYNSGKSCYWLPNQAFFDYYNSDSYDGLHEILEMGYQADPGSNYESALKNFYEYLDYCYAMVYDDYNIETPVYTEMAKAYLGTWENVSDSSCVIEVSPQPVDGYFDIEISWWIGTQYCINWTYAGVYNDDTGGIDCYHGSRSDFTKDGMTPFTEDIYTDIGEAELSLLNDDYLEWLNFSENMEMDFPEILFNFQRVTIP